MEKEKEKQKRDYSKLLFILVVSMGAIAIFGSIGYISLESNFSSSTTITNPLVYIMSWIWLVWITLVPLILFIIACMWSAVWFIETWDGDDDE